MNYERAQEMNTKSHKELLRDHNELRSHKSEHNELRESARDEH
jgi:propanediol dehydratase small subunit